MMCPENLEVRKMVPVLPEKENVLGSRLN